MYPLDPVTTGRTVAALLRAPRDRRPAAAPARAARTSAHPHLARRPAMGERTWPHLLNALLRGEELSTADTAWAMGEIMAGAATPAQIAGFAVALRAKGETAGRDRRPGRGDARPPRSRSTLPRRAARPPRSTSSAPAATGPTR